MYPIMISPLRGILEYYSKKKVSRQAGRGPCVYPDGCDMFDNVCFVALYLLTIF